METETLTITEIRILLHSLKLRVSNRETELLQSLSNKDQEIADLKQAYGDLMVSKQLLVNVVDAIDIKPETKPAFWQRSKPLKKSNGNSKIKVFNNKPKLERQEAIDPLQVERLKRQIKEKLTSIENQVLSRSPENTTSDVYTTTELQEMLDSLNSIPVYP